MTDALIRLPDKQIAPGIRDGIRERGEWLLEESVDGFGAVTPREGSGTITPYFRITKLCDATRETDARTWQLLARHPGWVPQDAAPRTRPGGTSDPDWRRTMHRHADQLAQSGRPGSDLAAVSATIFALEAQDVPAYLDRQAPALFEQHPHGSFWFLQTDELLLRRTALIRVLLAFELLPDYPDVLQRLKTAGLDDYPQIQTLQEHTLTHGFQFACLLDPILLSIPPATLGYVFPRPPHALVFLFGHPASLVVPHPVSIASEFAPGIQRGEFGDHWDSDFFEGIAPGEIESLLQWWMSRLNTIYSHATDPTAFANPTTGHVQPSQMTAWLLTFERMLADMLAIASMPQGAPITRLAMTFDLLDKAESLLGYRKKRSGDGMKRLLNRTEMVRRLDRIWDERLPLQLRQRFKQHTRALYDRVYQRVKDEAYEYRLHGRGIQVWSHGTGALQQRSWDSYVPALVRAVRNSSHGLLEALDSADRGIIETHSGQLPAELPDLACLIAIALVADAERLCARTWLADPARVR